MHNYNNVNILVLYLLQVINWKNLKKLNKKINYKNNF